MFKNVSFEGNEITFEKTKFKSTKADFRGTTFEGKTTNFNWTTFNSDEVIFSPEVKFKSTEITEFSNATFKSKNSINFNDSVFERTRQILKKRPLIQKIFFFKNSTFGGASTNFDDAKFCGDVLFNDTKFLSINIISFVNSIFKGDSKDSIDFKNSVFESNKTDFNEATFDSKDIIFENSTFGGNATCFNGTIFCGNALFYDTKFLSNDITSFVKSIFKGDWTSFINATFNSKENDFSKAKFFSKLGVGVSKGCFNGETKFNEAFFLENTSFNERIFSAKCSFNQANFRQTASFRGAIFEGPLDFSNAQFHFTTFEPLYSSAEFHAKPTEFHGEIKLAGCHYDILRVQWEKFAEHLKYDDAVYAQLEDNFRKIGFFEDADEVYFEHMRKKRQVEAKNKYCRSFAKFLFIELSCGYGVKPFRPILYGLAIIALFCIIYYVYILKIIPRTNFNYLKDLGKAFIFSLDVFITDRQIEFFKYNDWFRESKSVKAVVAFESVLGWFLWALFLATYVRSLIAS